MIKIDIISGFLGAGKTTFIQMLLKHYMSKGEKTVYVVNEFGKQGVDGLLMENENCAVYELVNGCICCSLRTDFILILKDIVEQIAPDRIVFEPSGVFVFSEFFEFLKVEPFKGSCEIDQCISVVDTVAFPSLLRGASYYISNQTRNSNLVILSKTQLENAAVDETICDIKNISPNIEIVNIPFSDFTPAVFDEVLAHKPIAPKAFVLKGRTKGIRGAHTSPKTKHSVYESIGFEVEPFENYADIEAFTNKILDKKFGDVIRGKGFVNHGADTYLINIVADQCNIELYKYPEESRFTIIGTDLSVEGQL